MPETHPDIQEAPSWLFDNIAELSKHTRTVHAVQIGFLIYCAFTVLTTPDRKIILNEQAHLPIINLDVPFSGFVLGAPFVAIVLFIDFQIHLQVLKATIDRARAKYPKLDRGRFYPWFGNLVLEPEPGVLGMIQKLMAAFSLWLLMPVVLVLLSAFTLKKHVLRLEVFEWTLSCFGSVLVLWFWHRYDSGRKNKNRMRIPTGVGLIMLTHVVLLSMMSPVGCSPKWPWFNVDLSNQKLIHEQNDGSGPSRTDLRDVRLDGANLNNSTLTKADLSGAKLECASMQKVNATAMILSSAHLKQVDMFGADLTGVYFDKQADLTDVNLSCSKLDGAHFEGANLTGAILVGVDITKANLSFEQLITVATLFNATMKDDLRTQLSQSKPELLAEPPSLESVLDTYPTSLRRANLVKFDDFEDPVTQVISEEHRLVLIKSDSNFYAVHINFSRRKELKKYVPLNPPFTEEVVRPIQMSRPFLIPAYPAPTSEPCPSIRD